VRLEQLRSSHRIELGTGHVSQADNRLVANCNRPSGFSHGAHRQLGLTGYTKLADDHDVERRSKGDGNLLSYGDPATR
jgi:hypothetical protein